MFLPWNNYNSDPAIEFDILNVSGEIINSSAGNSYDPEFSVYRNQSDLSGEIYVNVHEHGQATITELSEQVGYVLSIHESHLLKPKVDSNWYNKEISENASIGSSIGVAAFAEDLDGDEIFYSLAKDVSGLFAIDGTSGVITLVGELDYETSTSHVITVTATSNGEVQALRLLVMKVR